MAKRRGQPVHGWVNLDKPVGVSSAKAVAIVRRVFNAAKAGHGGTLDPLASGILPIALGEATKTVSYAMDGRKSYAFAIRWGSQTSTDDGEGDVIATSEKRPSAAEIESVLPDFKGEIWQTPPAFSAIKIGGKRAYELARKATDKKTIAKDSVSEGKSDADTTTAEMPQLSPRQIMVNTLELREAGADEAVFYVDCGKGTYIRSLARDIAKALGTVGHVSMLRRLSVGPFGADRSISLDFLESLEHSAAAFEHIHPVVSALDDIPAVPISENEARQLRQGQRLAATGSFAQMPRARSTDVSSSDTEVAVAMYDDQPVALVTVGQGGVKPVRVFNL